MTVLEYNKQQSQILLEATGVAILPYGQTQNTPVTTKILHGLEEYIKVASQGECQGEALLNENNCFFCIEYERCNTCAMYDHSSCRTMAIRYKKCRERLADFNSNVKEALLKLAKDFLASHNKAFLDAHNQSGDTKIVYTMDEICTSITNGSFKNALQQLNNSEYELIDLVESLTEEERHKDVITILKVAFHIGYLVENENLPAHKFH